MPTAKPAKKTATWPAARFFSSPSEFRAWLEEDHGRLGDAWIGFHKKSAGKTTLTYSQALDEALCLGWIDGVRKSIDASSYMIRFSPRKPRSIWSRINIRRAMELKKLGRMRPSGLKAFAAREAKRSGIYSFENKPRTLGKADEAKFRADRDAWRFFEAQPPGYRRTATYWVLSAKREETRQRRLAKLIEDSRHGRRLGLLTRPDKGSPLGKT